MPQIRLNERFSLLDVFTYLFLFLEQFFVSARCVLDLPDLPPFTLSPVAPLSFICFSLCLPSLFHTTSHSPSSLQSDRIHIVKNLCFSSRITIRSIAQSSTAKRMTQQNAREETQAKSRHKIQEIIDMLRKRKESTCKQLLSIMQRRGKEIALQIRARLEDRANEEQHVIILSRFLAVFLVMLCIVPLVVFDVSGWIVGITWNPCFSLYRIPL